MAKREQEMPMHVEVKFVKLFTGKGPECQEIKCISGDVSDVKHVCKKDFACDGFTYKGGEGCLKKFCHNPDKDPDRFLWKAGVDYYAKEAGFDLEDEQNVKTKEKNHKKEVASKKANKEASHKKAATQNEAANKVQEKKETIIMVKEKTTKYNELTSKYHGERQEKWSRPYWDVENGFATCTPLPCHQYADSHCHGGGVRI